MAMYGLCLFHISPTFVLLDELVLVHQLEMALLLTLTLSARRLCRLDVGFCRKRRVVSLRLGKESHQLAQLGSQSRT